MKRTCKLSFAYLGLVHCAFGLTPLGWEYQQDFTLEESGLIQIQVPVPVVAKAKPDLSDLRILDEKNNEVPFSLLGDPGPAPEIERATAVSISIEKGVTTVEGHFEAGNATALQFETPTDSFIASVEVEVRKGTDPWVLLTHNAAVFRQNGEEQLRLPTEGRNFNQVRCRFKKEGVNDFVVTGIIALLAPGTAPLVIQEAVPFSFEDFGNDSVVTLELSSANLPIESIALDIDDPIFKREVTVFCRSLKDEKFEDRVLGKGEFRREPNGDRSRGQTSLNVVQRPNTRYLMLRISNGDSPSLKVTGAHISLKPTKLAFQSSPKSKYRFLVGNPQATKPSYDLANYANGLRTAPVATLSADALKTQKEFTPPAKESVPATGAPLNPDQWKYARSLTILEDGIQQLELDPQILANLREDLRDLRLSRDGIQVPYIIERANLLRSNEIKYTLESTSTPKNISRWKLHLPTKRLRIENLEIEGENGIFKRNLKLIETRENSRGESVRVTMANPIEWIRSNRAQSNRLLWPVHAIPEKDEITIETDNGDNQPLPISRILVQTPVVRVFFPALKGENITLLADNFEATTPRYDLGLIADEVLRSATAKPLLSETPSTDNPSRERSMNSSKFWIVLAILVAGILAVIGKLLPKHKA